MHLRPPDYPLSAPLLIRFRRGGASPGGGDPPAMARTDASVLRIPLVVGDPAGTGGHLPAALALRILRARPIPVAQIECQLERLARPAWQFYELQEGNPLAIVVGDFLPVRNPFPFPPPLTAPPTGNGGQRFTGRGAHLH